MEEVYHTFKKNVGYNVTVRRFREDHDGVTLNSTFPTVRIPSSKLRDFLENNKRVLREGLIREVPEESLDYDAANSLSDEDVATLLGNFQKLKATLPTIDSLPILYKILNVANSKEMSKRTKSIVQARIDEIEPDEDLSNESLDRYDMKGSYDGF